MKTRAETFMDVLDLILSKELNAPQKEIVDKKISIFSHLILEKDETTIEQKNQ